MDTRSIVAFWIALASRFARSHGGLLEPGIVAHVSICMTGRSTGSMSSGLPPTTETVTNPVLTHAAGDPSFSVSGGNWVATICGDRPGIDPIHATVTSSSVANLGSRSAVTGG